MQARVVGEIGMNFPFGTQVPNLAAGRRVREIFME